MCVIILPQEEWTCPDSHVLSTLEELFLHWRFPPAFKLVFHLRDQNSNKVFIEHFPQVQVTLSGDSAASRTGKMVLKTVYVEITCAVVIPENAKILNLLVCYQIQKYSSTEYFVCFSPRTLDQRAVSKSWKTVSGTKKIAVNTEINK